MNQSKGTVDCLELITGETKEGQRHDQALEPPETLQEAQLKTDEDYETFRGKVDTEQQNVTPATKEPLSPTSMQPRSAIVDLEAHFSSNEIFSYRSKEK